jgi:hypothetical protein
MNKSKILETLQQLPSDKWTQKAYVSDGSYCSLGWLLHVAGVSDETLELASSDDDWFSREYNDAVYLVNRTLKNKYGISKEGQDIVEANDRAESYEDMIARVEKIVE